MSELTSQGYEFFEHTADVGLRAVGATPAELLANAAKGIVALLVEEGPLEARQARSVSLQADSFERLLVAWLKEVLFWFHADRFLPVAYDLRLDGLRVEGTVRGDRFDPSRHAPGTEIKGVTWHQLSVTQTPHGWQAQVIVDV